MNRRKFLQKSIVASVGLSFLSFFSKTNAFAGAPDGKTACSDSDPVANALGYKANAADIDKAKYPQFKTLKKNQNCKGCALFKEIAGSDGWGNCTMLASCVVAEKGLCGSWQKKA